MMITGLDHIGIAVESIDEALEFYEKRLGLKPGPVSVIPSRELKLVKLSLGNFTVELLEPLSPESTIARFLKKRGEGLHHIGVTVKNIEETLAELKRCGVLLIDETPQVGASGRRIAFIRPESGHGVLLELCEMMSGEA